MCPFLCPLRPLQEPTLEYYLSNLWHSLRRSDSSPDQSSKEWKPFQKDDVIRPVHRLDKDVEGPLVMALNREKAAELSRMFKRHQVTKCEVKLWTEALGRFSLNSYFLSVETAGYYALVSRYIPPSERPPVPPLGQETSNPIKTLSRFDPHGRIFFHDLPTVPTPPGKRVYNTPARGPPTQSPKRIIPLATPHIGSELLDNFTTWTFIGGSEEHNVSLVKLHPLSGRKHQLRVFCSGYLKAPIVGDLLHGWQPPSDPDVSEKLEQPLSAPREVASPSTWVSTVPLALSPSKSTPLFLRCMSVEFNTFPLGVKKTIRVEGAMDTQDGGAWLGVRELLDDWVGDVLPSDEATSTVKDVALTEEAERERKERVLRKREAKKTEKRLAGLRKREEQQERLWAAHTMRNQERLASEQEAEV